MTRQRPTFTPEFKLQLVKLYEIGKSRADIAREYDITPSALDRWIKNHQETGSFAAKDNRTEEENEMARLRKENQRLLIISHHYLHTFPKQYRANNRNQHDNAYP